MLLREEDFLPVKPGTTRSFSGFETSYTRKIHGGVQEVHKERREFKFASFQDQTDHGKRTTLPGDGNAGSIVIRIWRQILRYVPPHDRNSQRGVGMMGQSGSFTLRRKVELEPALPRWDNGRHFVGSELTDQGQMQMILTDSQDKHDVQHRQKSTLCGESVTQGKAGLTKQEKLFTQPGDVTLDQTSRNNNDEFADKPTKGDFLGEIWFEYKYLVGCETESGRTSVDGKAFAEAGDPCASFEPTYGVDGEQSSHLLNSACLSCPWPESQWHHMSDADLVRMVMHNLPSRTPNALAESICQVMSHPHVSP